MILVFDLGTSHFKFALIDRGGRLVDSCRIEPPVRLAPPGTAELDAEAFVSVLAQGTSQLAARNPGDWAAVQAVTFAAQTNSFVLLDAAGHPLTPIILWSDERAGELEKEFRWRFAQHGAAAVTGVPAVSRQFMGAKLLWFQRHAPRVWAHTAKICLISDYLTLLLTGSHVTEAGTAGLTGLLDIHHFRWWPELLDRLDVAAALLPRVVRAGTDLGPIADSERHGGRSLQDRLNSVGNALRGVPPGLGLSPQCRFVVGCLDQYAGAMGVGNVRPGSVSETTGTVLATVHCTDQFHAAPPAVFQGPAFAKSLYYQMVFGEVSANYLDWYRRQLPDRPDFAWLVDQAAQSAPHESGLRLRPGVPLSSLEDGSPLGAVFEGLTTAHTPGQIVRCIMEAVAAALGEQVMTLCHGTLPAEIRSAGGGARSDLWLQIKADALKIPVRATECPEPACLGAAMLAEAALGGEDIPAIAQRWVLLKHSLTEK